MKNPLSFYKKLKKLIEEEKPENVEIVYDMKDCLIYVIKKGYKFKDKRPYSNEGTSWHGVLTPVAEPSRNLGHERKAVIEDGIYVPMEAVSDT